MDGITNTISDMCYPQIFPNIGVDTIDGKSVIVIEIYPGASRPSYNEVHQKVHQSSPKSSPKSSLKSSPKDVNQTQQKILDMILENPEITQTAMAEKLDITPRAVKKNIKELVEKGLVKRKGSDRKGYWKIKE